MEINYADISRQARFDPLQRVYLFEGKEDAQKHEALDKLAAQVLDESSAAFDMEAIEGQGLTSERLFTAAGVLPFSSEKRMVVVRRANTIPSAEQEAIAQRLSGLPRSCVVVFFVPAPEVKDGSVKASAKVSTPFTKAISAVGAVVKFGELKADDAVRDISRRIFSAGKKIDGTALRRLVDRVGTDLSVLQTEAQKLIDFTGDNSVITLKDVELVTEQKPEDRIWKLMDAIGTRNAPLALRFLRENLENAGNLNKEIPRTLSLMARQLRLIWQARIFADNKWNLQSPPEHAKAILPSDNNIVTFCRGKSYHVTRLREQARNFTLADLERCFEHIAAADLSTKGAGGEIEDPAVVLELLIVKLCRRPGTTQTRDNP